MKHLQPGDLPGDQNHGWVKIPQPVEQASRLVGKFPGVAVVIIPHGIIDGLVLEVGKALLLIRGRFLDI